MIFVTYLIYNFLLLPAIKKDPELYGEAGNYKTFGNISVHYLVPLLSFANWLLFANKGLAQWSYAVFWIAIPLLYAVVIFIRGEFGKNIPGSDGKYPYEFISKEKNENVDTKNLSKFLKSLKISETADANKIIQELAEKYIERKIIPEKKMADAFHIAICVIKGIDYLVSWNYKHLANINKENKIRLVNLEYGYRIDLRIITPLELMDYGI